MKRASGILLHISSLPSPYGIGDLGYGATNFVDFLVEAGQSYWQILPIGPTGYGDSPYQSLSSFAGNHLLVSPDLLYEDRFLSKNDLDEMRLPDGDIDYAEVIRLKKKMFEKVYDTFRRCAGSEDSSRFERFCQENKFWLDDYSLFAALKDKFGGKAWVEWPEEIANLDAKTLDEQRITLQHEIGTHKLAQYLFYDQWEYLSDYANKNGIKIIGDIPIFVAHDSVDVWANKEMFHLDEKGYPSVVAGAPPSRFSSTGQKWGNALYNWEKIRDKNYDFWAIRMYHLLSTVNWVRIDHFRGFISHWEIPAEAPTAESGAWKIGPGYDLFEAMQKKLGPLNVIAENLGYITWDVEALRKKVGAPGMAIMQFAFDGHKRESSGIAKGADDERFLPHNHDKDCVVYTGTHDNDTIVGWWNECADDEKRRVMGYAGKFIDHSCINWTMIRLCMQSVAALTIFPMQDVLGLDSKSRMNIPGTPNDNWKWRIDGFQNLSGTAIKMRRMTKTYSRL